MEKFSYYVRVGLGWLKSRSYLTLAVGAAFGALLDDPLIGLLKLIF